MTLIYINPDIRIADHAIVQEEEEEEIISCVV